VLIIGNFYVQILFESCLLLRTTVSAFSLVVPVSAVTAVSRVLCFMTNKLIDWLIDWLTVRRIRGAYRSTTFGRASASVSLSLRHRSHFTCQPTSPSTSTDCATCRTATAALSTSTNETETSSAGHHHHHHIRLIALDKMQGCLHRCFFFSRPSSGLLLVHYGAF